MPIEDCGQLARKVPKDGLQRCVKDYLSLLRHPLQLGRHVKLPGKGLNFGNGLLIPDERRLYPHQRERFVTSTIPAEFKAKELPSLELRQGLLEWCSSDPHTLRLCTLSDADQKAGFVNGVLPIRAT